MTITGSGQISFFDINVELGRSGTAQIGLDEAENGTYAAINRCGTNWPSSANPAIITEWYNYNHTYAPTNQGTFDASTTSCAAACALNQDCSITLYTGATGAYYLNTICTSVAGNGVTTYYADCARTNCYTILNGSLSSTTACATTTTTSTTTAPPCSPNGSSCPENDGEFSPTCCSGNCCSGLCSEFAC